MLDISVFGRYTYLVTELVWGTVAVLLLRRANALRKAAITILALYPIAYVWDRYTLAVGVFDITLRTGIDIAGIPLEEHLFMAVVPGLVVGIHETIFGDCADVGGPGTPTP
ncbi:lycopene cyclase domain-containing protein [Natrinema salaciae]|uniref:Lycopene cyclase domain-containing protein n=1 Tax=Natrinema salaciae TaxID=1186196 RepID=A0A1H8ZP15_9EURY|nr:lycopene cyclase domain-containing protein [Natrinema salaciae]SEP65408.1 lycopene cyclase domain-containing protein [Natrinema salaciae]